MHKTKSLLVVFLMAALMPSPSVAHTPQAAQTPQAPQAPNGSLAEDFTRFVSWFGGEWNNNEQIWQQKIDVAKLPGGKSDDPISHTHHIFAPVVAPKLGSHVYYIQQHLDADLSKSYRQRIYRMTADEKEQAIKLEIFTLPDEKTFFNAHLKPELFATLEERTLTSTPGCEVYWRFDASRREYVGTMKENACSFVSKRSGKRIIVSDTLKLTDSEIWINDQARDEQGAYVFGSKTNTPIKNRKVRYFNGWMTINRAGAVGKAGDGNFSSRRDLLIHSEGQVIPLLYEDGTPSPYLIELAQLTYQNTKTAILKLALLDKETKKSVTYIWADIGSSRIGMNLGWFQMGFTQKASRVSFGYGDGAVK